MDLKRQKTEKFGKVELLLKEKDTFKYMGGDLIPKPPKKTVSTEKLTFEDAGLVLSGNYLIVILDEQSDIQTTNSSTGQIFSLADIKSYKIHSK